MKQRFTGLAALLVVAALLATACAPAAPARPAAPAPAPSPGPIQGPAPSPGAAPAPLPAAKGGKISAAYTTEPSSLAPWRSGDTNTHYVFQAIYDSLVEHTPAMTIEPSLAESWTVTPDGKEWTFKLRQDVKFHNGRPFNAAAAKANLDYIANPPKGYINGYDNIQKVEVVDNFTIKVFLKNPDNQFLIGMASRSRGMVEPESMAQLGEDFGNKPVGTGPFKFDKWVRDSTITVVRNPDYWRRDELNNRLPYLEQIDFKVVKENAARFTALATGQVDLDFGTLAENVRELEQRGFTVFKRPSLGYLGLRLLMTWGPLQKKEVRQALAWASDREAINEAIYFGQAFPGYTMYSPPTPGFQANRKPYGPRDVNKARALLQQAGQGPFTMEMIVTSQSGQQMAEILQANYKEIGVDVKILMQERGVFLQGIIDRKWQSYIDGLAGRFDPSHYYSHLKCDAVYNGHNYCNKTVDKLALEDGIRNFADPLDPKRIELYKQAEAIVLDEVPFVPLIHPLVLYSYNAKLKDVAFSPPGRVYWYRAFVQK